MTEWINMENFKQKAYNVFELFDQQFKEFLNTHT